MKFTLAAISAMIASSQAIKIKMIHDEFYTDDNTDLGKIVTDECNYMFNNNDENGDGKIELNEYINYREERKGLGGNS